MKRPNTELTRKFIQGLEAHGLTYEDVKQIWKYAGGNMGSDLNYYNLCYSHLEPPAILDRCVCEHPIKENCYATNGKYFLVIGNCCIKKFLAKKTEPATNAGSHTKTGSLIDVNFVAKGVAIVVGFLVVQYIKEVLIAIEEISKCVNY